MINLSLFKKTEQSYYISDSGDSNNNGLSPQYPKTIEDVSSLDFSVIKNIKFKAGGIFYGNFTIDYANVKITRYGIGVNPILDNSEDISELSWIHDSGDYWYAETSNPGWVMLNNDFLKCAYSSWITITSRTSNTITFDTTGLDTDNLVGGYVSIRDWNWNCTKYYQITDYSEGTITLDDDMWLTDSGKEFIIINRYQFLASGSNQWAYDDDKIWIRSSVNPSTLNLRKTSREALITISQDNATIRNIDFQNTYVTFINFGTNDGLNVLNCNFTNSKFYAIFVYLGNQNKVNIRNCIIDNTGDCALNLKIEGGGIIKNNIVRNNGTQLNYPFWYTNEADTYPGTLCVAIKTVSEIDDHPEWVIENNTVDNCAWSAIMSRGQNSTIRYNKVSNWHRRFTDGGGIYVVSQQNGNPNTNYEISYNICHCESVGEDGSWVSAGIYTDLYNTGFSIHHNIVYDVTDYAMGCGYFTNTDSTEITLENNIFVGCYNGMFFYGSKDVTNYIQNNIIATRNTRYCWATNRADETIFFKNGGYQDNNYYFNPYGTLISKSQSGTYNFADFKTQTGQDANSVSKSNWLTYVNEATAKEDVKLYTNEADTDTTIIAPPGYEDIDGNDVSNQELTVPAYYGLLILKS
jgi:hypothetical protein